MTSVNRGHWCPGRWRKKYSDLCPGYSVLWCGYSDLWHEYSICATETPFFGVKTPDFGMETLANGLENRKFDGPAREPKTTPKMPMAAGVTETHVDLPPPNKEAA